MKQHRKTLFGMPVDIGLTPENVIQRIRQGPLLLSYLNPYAWSVAQNAPDYRKNLNGMDLVVCDGIAVRRAVSLVFRTKTSIISLDYSGIGGDYLGAFQQDNSAICLVGGRRQVVKAARERLQQQFPKINITAAFAGYDDGPGSARDFILESRPEVVLAGMGMGVQEKYLLKLKRSGWSGTGICVGAFFDRLANPNQDYPAWSRKLNIRFLGNISRRPGYYLRRYGIDYQPFMKHYLKYLMQPRKKDE